MNKYTQRINALIASYKRKVFVKFEKLKARCLPGHKMRILFSANKPIWVDAISRGFRTTPHEITFAQLSADNIHNFDLVVPLTVDDLIFLNESNNKIPGNPIPIPSTASVMLCDNKYEFNQALIKHGFSKFIPQIGGDLSFPYILKKTHGEWGENCHLITNAQQELEYSELIKNPEYFSQSFTQGCKEYATHIIFKNKQVVCSLNIEYGFDTDAPIKGKDQPVYQHICKCPYLDHFSSILIFIEFEGLCCFNYKVKENIPQILEINPRFGGSLGPLFFSFMQYLI